MLHKNTKHKEKTTGHNKKTKEPDMNEKNAIPVNGLKYFGK